VRTEVRERVRLSTLPSLNPPSPSGWLRGLFCKANRIVPAHMVFLAFLALFCSGQTYVEMTSAGCSYQEGTSYIQTSDSCKAAAVSLNLPSSKVNVLSSKAKNRNEVPHGCYWCVGDTNRKALVNLRHSLSGSATRAATISPFDPF
jgi:hypothetical protein